MDMDIEMNEPYTILNVCCVTVILDASIVCPILHMQGLSGNDLEDLLEDIKVYMDLEQAKHLDYWKVYSTAGEDACSFGYIVLTSRTSLWFVKRSFTNYEKLNHLWEV